jgi:chondroitin AC lyase
VQGAASIGTCLPSVTVAAASGAENDIDTILQRLRAEFIKTINPGNAARFLAQQGKDGSWPDIDYADRASASWKPSAHLERARGIAAAYSQPTNAMFQSPQARSAVLAALQAWMDRKPVSTNWWQNTVGGQLALMPVLVLLDQEIPAALRQSALGVLNDPGMVPAAQATGQNLVWYATQQLVRGAVGRNADDLAAASRRLQDEVVVTTKEGIQADFSFHQHGAQLYSGAYGLGFLTDSVRLAGLLAGTPWAYQPDRLALLAGYALDGIRPLVRGPWLDWGARGREFTRAPGISRPQALLPAVQALATLAPDRRDELAAFAAYIASAATGAPVVGNRHFWRSDFMVHQTIRGYWSVKMVSARTVGTESGNEENLQGYWLPFGCTYLLRRGDEYDGLPAVWDWRRLPGVTAPAEVPKLVGLQGHEARFVGGVSDGKSGVAAMVLGKLETTARKAWFFHGDLMVALGAAIGSKRAAPVTTTLNQTRWRTDVVGSAGPVAAGGGAPVQLDNLAWLWHDGITYLLPGQAGVSLQLQDASGSGKAINRQLGSGDVRARVLTLAIDHGVRPDAASYAYGVWMGAASAADAGKGPAYTVLENSDRQQSIRHGDGAVVQAVMHAPGNVRLDNTFAVQVDQACLLQVVRADAGWTVSVCDPTTSLQRINITLNGGAEPRRAVAALTAGAPDGGRTVSVQLPR